MAEPSAWATGQAHEMWGTLYRLTSSVRCAEALELEVARKLDAAVADLEAEGVTLADEAIALRLTVEAREQTIAALRRQYNEQLDRVARADAETSRIRYESEGAIAEQAATIEDLTSEVTAWRSTAQNEKAQTIAQHERAEEAYREVATLKAVIEGLREALQAFDDVYQDRVGCHDCHGRPCDLHSSGYFRASDLAEIALRRVPASLRARVAAERAVIEAARNHVHPRKRFGDVISPGITCAICAALAALAARPEAT